MEAWQRHVVLGVDDERVAAESLAEEVGGRHSTSHD